ncbi:MAG: hypothetical protein GY714_20050 [Desulfobacterales bacterium]|nr:hypothetical protein [Desulfobacterales bacterium]
MKFGESASRSYFSSNIPSSLEQILSVSVGVRCTTVFGCQIQGKGIWNNSDLDTLAIGFKKD